MHLNNTWFHLIHLSCIGITMVYFGYSYYMTAVPFSSIHGTVPNGSDSDRRASRPMMGVDCCNKRHGLRFAVNIVEMSLDFDCFEAPGTYTFISSPSPDCFVCSDVAWYGALKVATLMAPAKACSSPSGIVRILFLKRLSLVVSLIPYGVPAWWSMCYYYWTWSTVSVTLERLNCRMNEFKRLTGGMDDRPSSRIVEYTIPS